MLLYLAEAVGILLVQVFVTADILTSTGVSNSTNDGSVVFKRPRQRDREGDSILGQNRLSDQQSNILTPNDEFPPVAC